MLLGLLWNPRCILQERLSQSALVWMSARGQVWDNIPCCWCFSRVPLSWPRDCPAQWATPTGSTWLLSTSRKPVLLPSSSEWHGGIWHREQKALFSSTLTGTIRIGSVCFLLGLSSPDYCTTHPFLSSPVSVWVVLKVGGGRMRERSPVWEIFCNSFAVFICDDRRCYWALVSGGQTCCWMS